MVMEDTLEGMAMKPTYWFALIVVAAILGGVVGAGVVFVMGRHEQPLTEGVILSVKYQQGSGTGGFARLNSMGSPNVDAYGKLYRDFLVITFPNGTGPEVIPTHRLLSVRFGDGGYSADDLKEMSKTAPQPTVEP